MKQNSQPKNMDEKKSFPPPLSTVEKALWNKNGFLILKNILTEGEIKNLRSHLDQVVSIHENDLNPSKNTSSVHGKEYYNIHNPFDFTDQFDYLIDHPKLFDIVTYLMGPYIEAMSCHIFVRHPSSASSSNIGRFHTDSGSALQRILPTESNLPLQLKFQFFLTDLDQDNMSNFIAIPGSHKIPVNVHHPFCLIPQCNRYLDEGKMPPHAVQLKVKAGDVLVHQLNLWHAVAPNQSSYTRKSISIRYGQMFFKSYYFQVCDKILNRMTPRQKRLLGCYPKDVRGDVAYRPPYDQVPLMLGEKAEAYGWSMDYFDHP